MKSLADLDPIIATKLVALAEEIAEHDGIAAFGATALADLRRPQPRDEYAVLMEGEEPVAFAWCDGTSAEFGVRPDHRGKGLGQLLLRAVHKRYPTAAVWAHGNLPGAEAVARDAGLRPVRELWYMECELGPIEELMEHNADEMAASLKPPAGMVLRGFREGDEADWVHTNQAAFADHPEQSQVDEAAFAELREEKWWQPHLLRLLTIKNPAPGEPAIAGFVWLKPAKPGVMEIFVVGVHPTQQRKGIGSLLMREALTTAVNMGATRAVLYVDGADKVAIHTYEVQGFVHKGTDVQYVGSESLTPSEGDDDVE
ncbi:mycothiol synthase [Bowdeniella massiliensis]|uniref:mycothiol synthase n=1 Tax=Bowdeniella massiliensis TaxID=2932264 RepID=UPI0020289A04|nr:mycothiol synthase [Bowdeniella massiliensis]